MPITVSVASDLNAELQQQLTRLYDTSPEFGQGSEALSKGEGIIAEGGRWYVGWFNGKPVAAIMASGDAQGRLLENIVVHPANRGRGIADRLVSEVCRQEREQGFEQFRPGCTAIARLLRMEAARAQRSA